jgi:ribosome-associated toxin RatA of RatAB toxin-antitoxin module
MDGAHAGPVVQVYLGRGERPVGATATARVAAPLGRVWTVLSDVERFSRLMPMVSGVRRRGEDLAFDLKFKVGFFSAGFEFVARITLVKEKEVAIRWVSGEPRDLLLRFTMAPLEEDGACTVDIEATFELESLGWLVKFFLKNHPEIRHGIFPGVALVLHDSLRRALEA